MTMLLLSTPSTLLTQGALPLSVASHCTCQGMCPYGEHTTVNAHICRSVALVIVAQRLDCGCAASCPCECSQCLLKAHALHAEKLQGSSQGLAACALDEFMQALWSSEVTKLMLYLLIGGNSGNAT